MSLLEILFALWIGFMPVLAPYQQIMGKHRKIWPSSGAGIAIDSIDAGAFVSGTFNSLSWTHTTGSGLSNSALYCMVSSYSAVATHISSLTYNSSPLTKIIEENDGVHQPHVEIWRLLAPASGANAVAVTFSATLVNQYAKGGCISFSGVNQTTPEDGAGVGTVAGSGVTSISTNITTSVSNDWILDAVITAFSTTGVSVTPGAGTQAWIENTTNDVGAASYQGPVSTGAHSIVENYGASSSAFNAQAVVAIEPQ